MIYSTLQLIAVIGIYFILHWGFILHAEAITFSFFMVFESFAFVQKM